MERMDSVDSPRIGTAVASPTLDDESLAEENDSLCFPADFVFSGDADEDLDRLEAWEAEQQVLPCLLFLLDPMPDLHCWRSKMPLDPFR